MGQLIAYEPHKTNLPVCRDLIKENLSSLNSVKRVCMRVVGHHSYNPCCTLLQCYNNNNDNDDDDDNNYNHNICDIVIHSFIQQLARRPFKKSTPEAPNNNTDIM